MTLARMCSPGSSLAMIRARWWLMWVWAELEPANLNIKRVRG